MSRINRSWREQAKPVIAFSATSVDEFKSVWTAALFVVEKMEGKTSHATAKKEIRRAIKSGGSRYGYKWMFK